MGELGVEIQMNSGNGMTTLGIELTGIGGYNKFRFVDITGRLDKEFFLIKSKRRMFVPYSLLLKGVYFIVLNNTNTSRQSFSKIVVLKRNSE